VAVTVGTDGYQELFGGGTVHFKNGGRLLAAVDLGHYDGAWQPKQNFQKVNAALRYSQGSATDGFSLTGLYYKSGGRLITDQPERAIENGTISRFGTLDPSDHSLSERFSLSGHLDKRGRRAAFGQPLCHSQHDDAVEQFHHYLLDPVNGDQEEQDERRTAGRRGQLQLPQGSGRDQLRDGGGAAGALRWRFCRSQAHVQPQHHSALLQCSG
jgi:hypothetical protein